MCHVQFSKENMEEYVKSVKKEDQFSSIYFSDSGLYVNNYPGRLLRWNGKMFICPNMENSDSIHESLHLGFSASLVPFIHHNAGPRGIFISNMMKQTLSIDERFEKQWKWQDESKILTLTTKALKRERASMNVLVKWAIYFGYNIEDGIVVTRKFLEKTKEKGVRIYSSEIDIEEKEGEKEMFLTPRGENLDSSKYEADGTIKIGERVSNGTVLACKIVRQCDEFSKVFLRASVDSECIVYETSKKAIAPFKKK